MGTGRSVSEPNGKLIYHSYPFKKRPRKGQASTSYQTICMQTHEIVNHIGLKVDFFENNKILLFNILLNKALLSEKNNYYFPSPKLKYF